MLASAHVGRSRLVLGAAALALAIAGPAGAAVNDLLGLLRAHVAAADRLFLRVQPTTAYGQMRQVFTSPVPYAVDVPITIPPNARLRFGIAVRDTFLVENLVGLADPIRFTATLQRPSGEAVVLLDRTLAIRERPGDRRWVDLDLDLAPFAGEAGILRLTSETPGTPTAPQKTFALWSRPYVLERGGPPKPNLLFVTIDALRADHVGSYGYERPTTPALDRLAAEGVRFEKAFTNAPMTVPSLPQIFTSRHFPTRESPTLMSSLFAAPFTRTKAIISNPYLEVFLTLDARDSFDSVSSVIWDAERIARKGLEWIDAQRGERWALYLHVLDVHTPYRVRPPEGTRFADPAYRGPIGYGWGDTDGARTGKYDDPADRRHVVDLYDSALRYVDEHLGRLFDALRERGVLDDTLVVVSADHGEELWDRGGFFHGVSLYDEQLHVPLIMRLPKGAHAGKVVRPQVRAIDIVPTIVDALGTPRFPEYEGRSLLPLLAESGAFSPSELFARAANMTFPQRFALRTATHKLILTQQPFGEQLFDLVADPGERRDLAADPAMRPVRDELRERLAVYRAPLAATGFQVRAVAQPGTSPEVEVTIRSNDIQMVANPDRVGGDRADVLELASDGLTLTWRGRAGATPVGFRFDRAMRMREDTGLTIQVRADGADLPPAAIVLAGGDAHPPSSPFTYKTDTTKGANAPETPPLLVTTPPTPTAGDRPVRVHLWRVRDTTSPSIATTPTDEDTRRKLRSLGYAE